VPEQYRDVVLWRSLFPALSWQDGRGLLELEEADLNLKDVHSRTGLYKTKGRRGKNPGFFYRQEKERGERTRF